ncbi:MAG: hypothetical protein Q7U91_10590 [Sideroxyarcus sp.]|nr:hypothetical protein [Sideroxyarcus sp.]
MKNVFAEINDNIGAWASSPPFDQRHLRAIELALRAAWNALQNDFAKANQLSTISEERISHLLREELNKLREREQGGIKDYTCQIFERPQVGAEIITPDGKIRKPDIVFALSGNRRPGVSDGLKDGIFVECKILEQGTKKNISAYCNAGVHRFVEGSYSAWMREGMMLAYVRTSQTLSVNLANALKKEAMKTHLACNGKLKQCTLTKIAPRVYISVHKRAWPYPDGSGYPGPIEIRHLWFSI